MRVTSVVAAMMLLAGTCFAAEDGFVALFDGKTLDGWKIITCKVEVQDGAILLKEGNGVIRPEREFKDYVLDWECKSLKADNWDSGVYFRCGDPSGNWPWPRQYQANLRKGMEGNVDELKGAKSSGLYKAGEWNKFRLTVQGTKCAMEVNGQPAWKADGLKAPTGFISIQAEVPGGGQWLFRNIRVKELKAE